MMFLAVFFILWVLLLMLMKRQNLNFFVFTIGSIGLFCILMYIGRGTVEKHLEIAVTYCMYLLGKATGLYIAYPKYSMLTIYNNMQAVSFFVDYECSGFIETIVYISLLMFYPVYRWKGKLLLTVLGILYIFISNTIRVFVICVIIKAFGSSLFFFSHTVFARVLFFFLMIGLYYVVFTRPHILNQKVGNIGYDD